MPWLIFQAVMKFAQGLIGPIMAFETKKQDDILAGAQSGMTADNVTTKTELDYEVASQAIQAQASAWWGPRAMTFIVLMNSTFILTLMTWSFVFQNNWFPQEPNGLLKLMITMSLSFMLLHTASSLPIPSALTKWLSAKAGLLQRLTGK